MLSGLRLGAVGAATTAPGAWWSAPAGGWIGGAARSAVGVLLGVLDPVLAFSLLPTARRRFEELELRRMQGLDAR